MKTILWVITCIVVCTSAADIIIEEEINPEIFQDEVWTWECNPKGCEKQQLKTGQRPISMGLCRLACPSGGVLWPKPKSYNIVSTLISVNPHGISLANVQNIQGGSEASEMIQGAFEVFTELVSSLDKTGTASGKPFDVTLKVANPQQYRYIQGVNESYSLTISPGSDGRVNATITSETMLGARHGLETLWQLLVWDPVSGNIMTAKQVDIVDGPLYTHRGLSLDTSRNFISVPSLKRTLDAMAATKLNTFHWHITDSHSFPFQSQTYPNLTRYGAYSKTKVYTEDDIRDIVHYAMVRGIRVVPEFDAPAHVGEGWQWAENAVVCLAAEPWSSYCVEPPCGQLDPTSEITYSIIEGIYSDMARLFKTDHFHMGGDEVNIPCWESVERIVNRMKKMSLEPNNEGFHQLWAKFQERAREIVRKEFGERVKPVLWTSTLTEGKHLKKYLNSSDYIIQIWTKMNDAVIANLVNNGFQVIFSNYDALYFDCGFGAWVGTGNNWCSPYIPWQTVYQNDPRQILSMLKVDSNLHHLALGAEAALWTEEADDTVVDSRFWPRASAMGEALWSGPGPWQGAEHRLLYHREKLVGRGIQADTMQPQWCLQNQGGCYL